LKKVFSACRFGLLPFDQDLKVQGSPVPLMIDRSAL